MKHIMRHRLIAAMIDTLAFLWLACYIDSFIPKIDRQWWVIPYFATLLLIGAFVACFIASAVDKFIEEETKNIIGDK